MPPLPNKEAGFRSQVSLVEGFLTRSCSRGSGKEREKGHLCGRPGILSGQILILSPCQIRSHESCQETSQLGFESSEDVLWPPNCWIGECRRRKESPAYRTNTHTVSAKTDDRDDILYIEMQTDQLEAA